MNVEITDFRIVILAIALVATFVTSIFSSSACNAC